MTSRTSRKLSGVLFLALVCLAPAGCITSRGRWLFTSPTGRKTEIKQGTIVRAVQRSVPKGRPAPQPVERRFDSLILENGYLRVTLVPELGGRITNVVFKPTGRELFYEGPIEYTGNVFRGGGFNMGGIEVNHPYLHNGNAYCNPWLYTTETRFDGTAAVTMAFTSYPLLQRTVFTVSLAPDEAALQLTYRFENLTPYAHGFNPFINAVCRATGDAQIILPAEWITDHWFGANTGDRFHHLYPWPIDKDGTDRSYLKNLDDLTAFAYGFSEGYAGVYYHDQDAGFARAFDPKEMGGAKAWVGKKGQMHWFELWSSVQQNMEAPGWLAAQESRTVSDAWFPVQGIGGVTWACAEGAVNFQRRGEDALDVGVCVMRGLGVCGVRVVADGQLLLSHTGRLDPEHPFFRTVEGVGSADEARLEVLDPMGRVVLRRQVRLAPQPRAKFDLPENPWFRRDALAEARWHESFSPLCNWGPWWPPVQSYEKVLKDEPDNREAKIGLARALLKQYASGLEKLPVGGKKTAWPDRAKLTGAADVLRELNAAEKPELEVVYLLALAEMRLGDKGAAASFQKVLDRAPGYAMAHYHLALLAAQRQDRAEALKHARAAAEGAPDSTLARQLLALALLREGEADEAEGVLLVLHTANPAEAATVELLRRCAEASGKSDEAYQFALRLEHFRKIAPRQTKAGLDQLACLEAGREVDPRAVDTLSGPDLPGREP